MDPTAPVFEKYFEKIEGSQTSKFFKSTVSSISEEGILAIMRLQQENADVLLEKLISEDNDVFPFRKAVFKFSTTPIK
jgi:hypothetical protein